MAVPSNIPLGTYVGGGLRSGPFYTRQTVTTPDSNNIITSGTYNKWGPGVLYSPQNTWSIVPYPETFSNIVAETGVESPGYLTLTGDGQATTLLTGPNGQPYVQFDWPRVPGVRVLGGNLPNPVNVTIFGTDWYGFPLQHTYVVQNVSNYPGISSDIYNLSTPCKAFYTVTGVYCDAIEGGNGITLETTDIFGLPYRVNEWSDIINFSWAGSNMMDQSYNAMLNAGSVTVPTPAAFWEDGQQGNNTFLSRLTTAGTNNGDLYVGSATNNVSFTINSTNNLDTSTVNWLIKNGGQNLMAFADATNPATAFTGDVRGLFQLPGIGEAWAPFPDGTYRALITSYVFGADEFQNQLAALSQPQGDGTVPFLTAPDLFGVPQYYTGVPA